MSSIKCPQKTGRKMHFFSPFFAHFLLQNHYIQWLTCLICPSNHNSSSELYSQRVHSKETCPQTGLLKISKTYVATQPLNLTISCCAVFIIYHLYEGSTPSSLPKKLDVIYETEGQKIEGKNPRKGGCHAALTAWHLYSPKLMVEMRGIEPLTS